MIIIKIETSAEAWTNRCISPLRTIPPQDPKQRKISNFPTLSTATKRKIKSKFQLAQNFDSKFNFKNNDHIGLEKTKNSLH